MRGLANRAHDVKVLVDELSRANEGLQERVVELEKRLLSSTEDAPITKIIGLLGQARRQLEDAKQRLEVL